MTSHSIEKFVVNSVNMRWARFVPPVLKTLSNELITPEQYNINDTIAFIRAVMILLYLTSLSLK